MIPITERIIEDELFTEWLDYLARVNYDHPDKFKRIYLGNRRRKNVCITQPRLEDLCKSNSRSAGFPDPVCILRDHSVHYMLLPFIPKKRNALRAEQLLRNKEQMHFMPKRPNTALIEDIMICPCCVREDIEKYGRVIIHTCHQPFVKSCWKHGVRLVKKDEYSSASKPEPVSEEENRTAQFMRSLYLHPVYTSLEMTQELLWKNNIKNIKNINIKERIRLISQNFTFDEFAKEVETIVPESFYSEIKNLYRLLTEFGPVVRLQCGFCNYTFYADPSAVTSGVMCPECAKHIPEKALLQRYLNRHTDGNYRIVNMLPGGRADIIHEACGYRSHPYISMFIWDKSLCPRCYDRHVRKDRAGEETIAANGQKMRVKSYRSRSDVDVEFEDGTVVSGVRYDHFTEGNVSNPNNPCTRLNDRTGEKNTATNGQEIIITGYRDAKDLDVVFEDGTVVTGRSYRDFKEGSIYNRNGRYSYTKADRVGEVRKMNNGQMAEIIEYRSVQDIDVRFEDGNVVTNRRYAAFLAGKIKNPKCITKRRSHTRGPYQKKDHFGESATAVNGQKMVIIKSNGAMDITVMFEDGTIVEHKQYHHFLEGRIGKPNDRAKSGKRKRLG